MNEKYTDLFSPMEIDAIGEILNISLGSSATAMSDMLERRVSITTPNVNIVSKEEFDFGSLEPAIGVEIVYVSGIEGSNIMLLKRDDVKKILEILMDIQIEDDKFVLDEISLSAVCEIMNQMMGASATALADFIGEPVNISTPVSFEVSDTQEFKGKYFNSEEPMIVVGFKLDIENSVSSEFLTMMSIKLARRLIGSVTTLHDSSLAESGNTNEESSVEEDVKIDSNRNLTPEEIAATIQALEQENREAVVASTLGEMTNESVVANQPDPKETAPTSAPPQPAPMNTAPMPPQPAPMNTAPMPPQAAPMNAAPIPAQSAPMNAAPIPAPQQPRPEVRQQPRIIEAQPIYENFDADGNRLTKEQESNLDLIMSVPLQISVEIGRTKKLVKEILEFNHGTLVVLDKLAGEQVDLYVNGQCIAKGDVVVVDDSFGVKITEIIKKSDMLFHK